MKRLFIVTVLACTPGLFFFPWDMWLSFVAFILSCEWVNKKWPPKNDYTDWGRFLIILVLFFGLFVLYRAALAYMSD